MVIFSTYDSGSGTTPPEVATSYVTDAGTATPALNILNVLGGTGVDTAGAGDTITINSPSMLVTTYDVADSPGIWTKDSRTTYIRLIMWGGGGGGSSGRKGASAGTVSGGGGGGGGLFWTEGPESFFGATANFVVGAGGAGGASQTSDGGAQNVGTNGGNTTFGLSIAEGGTGGQASGTQSSVCVTPFFCGTAQSTSGAPTTSGGTSATNIGNVNLSVSGMATGGGSGGGTNTATERAGGTGGGILDSTGSNIVAPAAGGLESTGINGSNGATLTAINFLTGGLGGGGGGGYSVGAGGATTGGNGGNGSIPGGGGGGGGGGLNAVADSGPGGNGADGRIIVIEHFT